MCRALSRCKSHHPHFHQWRRFSWLLKYPNKPASLLLDSHSCYFSEFSYQELIYFTKMIKCLLFFLKQNDHIHLFIWSLKFLFENISSFSFSYFHGCITYLTRREIPLRWEPCLKRPLYCVQALTRLGAPECWLVCLLCVHLVVETERHSL